ncbi:MAG: thioredoxin family protein [Planctomycetes bacterium]|nr:thioredoxin family protein [Planctomycetota bacterium]
MKSMHSLHRIAFSALLVAFAVPVVAQDRIPWITDLRQAREVAERQHRLVLLHFWSDDCAPCKQVERNVFNQPEFIRALTTGYVPVKINANQQPQLADFYNIERVPTDVIVTPEGREVQRFQSLQDPNRYIAMLDGIRAQASVGSIGPVASSSTPIASRTPANAPASTPYESYSPPQPRQSRYGQGANDQTAVAVDAPPAATSSYGNNRYANPLNQSTAPQQQSLAPRYANPYGQEAESNSDTSGSRWGQQTPDYGSPNANPAPSTATPQTNEFVSPSGTERSASSSASLDWRQDRGAAHYDVAQNQVAPSQSTQHPSNVAPQNRYGVRAQPQPSAPQPQPNDGQPRISLEGYCPVTLVQNRVWTPGDKKWGAVHEGRVYLFAGPEQQKQFLANPHVYAPLMAGYDPVRFAETGQLVPGRREFGLYIDDPGPIALFADEAALERFHTNSGYYFNIIRQAKAQRAGRVTR